MAQHDEFDLRPIERRVRAMARIEGIIRYTGAFTGVVSAIYGALAALMIVCGVPAGLFVSSEFEGFGEGERVASIMMVMVLLAALSFWMCTGTFRLANQWRHLVLSAIIRITLVVCVPLLLIAAVVVTMLYSAVGASAESSLDAADLAPTMVVAGCGVLQVWYFGGAVCGAWLLLGQPVAGLADRPASLSTLRHLLSTFPYQYRGVDPALAKRYRRTLAWLFARWGLAVVAVQVALAILIHLMSLDNPIFSGDADDAPIILQCLGLAVGLVLAVSSSFSIANGMHDSRRFLLPTWEQASQVDSRPPVLLLRSFKDDEKLGHAPGLHFFSSSRASMTSIEEIVADRLWRIGPVCALGEIGGEVPPGGAARAVVETKCDEDWQRPIASLAHRASLIVVVAGATPGLSWELRLLRSEGMLGKVLLLIPAWTNQEHLDAMCARAGLDNLNLVIQPRDSRQRLVAVGFVGSGAVCYRGRSTAHGIEAAILMGSADVLSVALAARFGCSEAGADVGAGKPGLPATSAPQGVNLQTGPPPPSPPPSRAAPP